MSQSFDEKFFDFAMRILNYSIEFVNSPGYASLRMLDVLQTLVDLSEQIEGVSDKAFYGRLKKKFEERRLMSDRSESSAFLDELLAMFVEEWRRRSRG
jgi:hypothetical protein